MASIKGRRNHRLYPNANRSARPDLCEFRRKDAKDRQAAYDKLSVTEKLAMLDIRLGKGQGAKKQRERLQTLLVQQPSQPKKAAPEATSKDAKKQKESSDAKTYLGGKTINDVKKARGNE